MSFIDTDYPPEATHYVLQYLKKDHHGFERIGYNVIKIMRGYETLDVLPIDCKIIGRGYAVIKEPKE